MSSSLSNRLKQWLFRQIRPSQAGFTLLEVLIAAAIGSIMISSLLWLMVNLLSTERRESALSETERDMKRALDYIVADLKQAVYIYDGSCPTIGTTTVCPPYYYTSKTNRFLPSWVENINLGSGGNIYPVLAFWKTNAVAVDTALNSCSTYSGALSYECTDLKKRRYVYSLVVYTQDSSPSSTWSGKSIIQRFELSRYDNVTTLTPNVGYVDPTIAGVSIFTTWPFINVNGNGCNLQRVTTTAVTGCNTSLDGALTNTYAYVVDGTKVQNQVLTDFVDEPLPSDLSSFNPLASCPASSGYRMTPQSTAGVALSKTFYACVRSSTSVGQNQDVTIFLRGNTSGRSGIGSGITTAVLQTRVALKGVLDKSP